MRRAALLAVLASAAAAPALAMDHGHDAPMASVGIGYSNYVPSAITVLTGDGVRFTNDSVRAHTVTADDDSFDSGRIQSGRTFDLATPKAGEFPFHCSLHPGITGEVHVRDLLLAPPSGAAAPDRPYPLTGRTTLPAQTDVTIQADSGAGFADAAHATVQPDGSFTAQLRPSATASYRAVAGGHSSDPVRVIVLNRTVAVVSRRSRGRDVVTATVAPAAPGADVVLQVYRRDRFGWWPTQRAKLDARSQARFVLRTKRRYAVRVRLTLADGATLLAQSRTLHVGVRRLPH